MYAESPFDHVPANLGSALAARGFEKLTVVQEAVLAENLEGRDLRISSQTGSGKTVAIGLALARDLAAAERPESDGRNARPSLLLIAPTRELAAQLGDELRWLYEPLGKRLAVVTGGTSIGLDFKSFRRNPDVLVGTPGRLFDHVQRGSLNLSQLSAVVLDEADEMLDMGFRDELEGILSETPEERHTHMVSATFPREVLSLASRYQREAVTVHGENPKKANEDITHEAHLLRMGDRVDALINILLASPDERTLVFVRTRLSTADVATELTAAGFKAFPLNGEMGQRERTSTLDAFRDGKVQLLCATDVAARGLDIRGVTRIVHFDLPENPEAFTHRSGRTGRAGAKGTSILFVPPNGRRKVDYLTRVAKIRIDYKPVPSVAEIRASAQGRFLDSFRTESDQESTPTKASGDILKLAEKLLEEREATDVVAELLSRLQISGPTEPRHINEPRAAKANSYDRNDGPRGGGKRRSSPEDYTTFQVTWGSRNGADPRRLLALVCRRGNVRSGSIGAIRISDNNSVVDVRKQDASAFERAVAKPDSRDPSIKIRPWLDAGERGKFHGQAASRQPAHDDGQKRSFGKRSFSKSQGFRDKPKFAGKRKSVGKHSA